MNAITKHIPIVSVGLAMFSMFFGAGNVVFPLLVGLDTQNLALFALLGLVITAVGVPFAGLFAMTLFDGDYDRFFNRLGRWPGFLILLLIFGLIGPFGAIPRCITLSYSTFKMFFPNIKLYVFSLISCVTIFVLTIRKSRIVDILGYVLTPVLLLSLGVIIVKGIIVRPELTPTHTYTPGSSFIHGFISGYQTMDLLGAFFFCTVVIEALKRLPGTNGKSFNRNAFEASWIGASLLALVYIGLSIVAALHSNVLASTTSDMVLGTVALSVLGPYAGIITCVAVALACLTTAIALAAVFAEFVHYDIVKDRVNYEWSLIATLVVSFIVSTLEFNGIMLFLLPIVQLIYPSLLVLSLVNIANKLWGFSYVKVPVVVTFIISLILQLM